MSLPLPSGRSTKVGRIQKRGNGSGVTGHAARGAAQDSGIGATAAVDLNRVGAGAATLQVTCDLPLLHTPKGGLNAYHDYSGGDNVPTYIAVRITSRLAQPQAK
jgi:hypothetical protein